jgi:putative ABC transport system ATP-binding protein
VAQAGSLRVLGQDLAALGGAARDRFRADHVRFIFQLFNLIRKLRISTTAGAPPSHAKHTSARSTTESVCADGSGATLLA